MKRVPVRLKYGWTPLGVIAWVPRRRTIIVKHGVQPTIRTIAHELVHVLQYERHGLLFYLVYAFRWARGGFRHSTHPMEREARAAESISSMRAWAADLLENGGRVA